MTDVAEDTTSGRSMYLLGGRRVMVSDLLGNGLIKPGTPLQFKRSRIGDTFHATVTEQGRIRLEPSGEEFRSPSRAAMVAAGMRAVDGWRAWLVVDQDRLLDAVRQELLDQAITAEAAKTHQESEDKTRQAIHERLRQARARAEENKPERISVRELLGFWGAKDRGDQVSQIEADLANHGLVTSPGFRAVTLDTVVVLTTPPEDATAEPTSGDVPAGEDDEGDGDLDVGLTVGNLTELDGVESINPNGTLEEAITKMILNDVSQLAVLNGPRNLRGAVTWRSIAEARHRKPDATFADAIDSSAQAVPYDRDLFEVLPVLQEHKFVFVLDETRAVKGVVTTTDVARHYGEVSTPFFQLGELDQTLRWILGRAFDLPTIQRFCSRRVNSFDELSMGDYQNILSREDLWRQLGWPLDRAVFIEHLEQIRLIRNKVMHFHPDPIPADAVDKLRRFNRMLHRYRDLL
ncbi:CBS domain-containing protein [Amycolatopsis rhabdoformis]|uniref:CBS domain-containing protein n=1 Tax=Amycolatopsis rhabdoformis TaxID=1448059 RepID=A0ABZ1IAP4_9PSEU|nr:CBS domain-containing protein [Amycolatopsis rhabdoformis]WSE30992.1 CBS domain-containing protein [Amycolatopsis rhabdoformis]